MPELYAWKRLHRILKSRGASCNIPTGLADFRSITDLFIHFLWMPIGKWKGARLKYTLLLSVSIQFAKLELLFLILFVERYTIFGGSFNFISISFFAFNMIRLTEQIYGFGNDLMIGSCGFCYSVIPVYHYKGGKNGPQQKRTANSRSFLFHPLLVLGERNHIQS